MKGINQSTCLSPQPSLSTPFTLFLYPFLPPPHDLSLLSIPTLSKGNLSESSASFASLLWINMLGSEKVHSSTSALMSGYCSANSVAYKPPSDLHYMIIPLLPPPLPSSPFSIFFSLPPHLFSSPLPSLPSKADYFTLQDPQVSDQVVMDELQVFKETCVAYPPGYNILEKRREQKREEETKEKRKENREMKEG